MITPTRCLIEIVLGDAQRSEEGLASVAMASAKFFQDKPALAKREKNCEWRGQRRFLGRCGGRDR